MKYFIKLLLCLACLISGCEKYTVDHVNYQKSTGVFLLSEGNFKYANASLSFYEPNTKQIYNDVFWNTNGISMGDVAQSMILLDTLAFVVMNNSGKIIVFNNKSFKLITTITGLASPRYIHLINAEKAYVTDLSSNQITVFNPRTFKIMGSIKMGYTTEQLVQYQNAVYVINWSNEQSIQRIDCTADSLTDTKEVTFQPNSMVIDRNNKIWVLSDGGNQGDKNKKIAALTKIDASSFVVEKVFQFPSINFSPSRLTINGSGDSIYFISGGWIRTTSDDNGIFKMAVTDESLPLHPFIRQDSRFFYGLGVNPHTSEIYVTDPLDFVQPGLVFRYTGNGMAVDTFKTGIIPGSFCFSN